MRVTLPNDLIKTPITHRALHDRAAGVIENSTSAIEAAINAGYGIELDLQCSKDGIAMVFHDDQMNRLTEERGLVRDFTCAELRAIKLTDSEDTIAPLRDILKLVDGRVPLLLEIKDQSLTLGDLDGVLEKAVAEELANYTGSVAVMSFNPNSVALMQTYAPNVPRGLTTCDFALASWPQCDQDRLERLKTLSDYKSVNASFISHDCKDLSSPYVQTIKNLGDPILTWTIKSEDQEHQARGIADNITFEGYLAQTA